MKKQIFLLLSMIALISFGFTQNLKAQDIKEPWPGVKVRILLENDHVKVSEATFAPGAVADWHSHPQHTIYAVTDAKLKIEEKDKEPVTAELKAGQAIYSPPVTHRVTNLSTTTSTMIVTEIK